MAHLPDLTCGTSGSLRLFDRYRTFGSRASRTPDRKAQVGVAGVLHIRAARFPPALSRNVNLTFHFWAPCSTCSYPSPPAISTTTTTTISSSEEAQLELHLDGGFPPPNLRPLSRAR